LRNVLMSLKEYADWACRLKASYLLFEYAFPQKHQ
jgi:hypothetical protein